MTAPHIPTPPTGAAAPADPWTWVYVTPTLAMDWLNEHNIGNRRMSPSHVNQYTDEMTAGRWDPEASGFIIFDTNGHILDGQHRLAAVAASGAAQWFRVKTGADPHMRAVIDSGLIRTSRVYLAWDGEAQSTALAAALRLDLRWHQGPTALVRSNGKFSSGAVAEWLACNPGMREAVRAATRVRSSGMRLWPSALSAFIHNINKIDPAVAIIFLDDFTTGEGLRSGDPAYALRNWTINKAPGRKSPDDVAQLAVLVKAWGAAVTGRKVRLLSWRRGVEEFPALLDMNGNPVEHRAEIDAG